MEHHEVGQVIQAHASSCWISQGSLISDIYIHICIYITYINR